ncbi:MAG TPA: hypothetical protein DCF96_13525, partial [Rhodobacteraceae bacterium]|nr:hypothetical protein [Paracoccaceae bacterium]
GESASGERGIEAANAGAFRCIFNLGNNFFYVLSIFYGLVRISNEDHIISPSWVGILIGNW